MPEVPLPIFCDARRTVFVFEKSMLEFVNQASILEVNEDHVGRPTTATIRSVDLLSVRLSIGLHREPVR